MRKIVIILLSTMFLTSCNTKKSKKDYILFSGKISDARSNEFTMDKRYSGAATRIIPLAKDGSFSDTITAGTGFYSFRGHGGMNVVFYLTNGGEYNLTANGADVAKLRGTAKLTGTNPNASNYLFTKYKNISRLRGDYAEFNKLNESDFIATQKKLNESYISRLDSFPNIPKEFAEFEREELHYYHLLTLINYESLHQRYAEQPDFKVSADVLKELEGVNYVNEDAYKLRGSYTKLVEKHFKNKADELVENDGVDKYLAKLKVFGEIPNDFIKNSLIISSANRDISYTDNMEAYYNAYLLVSTSKKNDESITKKYEALKKLSRGQVSPIFTDYVNHAGGTSSLNDFKGKYVYVDIWATWCGPCLAEVPSLQKVEKQYHGKNIEFVSISIDVDSKRDSWRKMVTDKGLGGVQLIADKNWKSDFVAAYQISGIPRFILIDPKGNIVSSNAPRPSDSKLIKLFNELKI